MASFTARPAESTDDVRKLWNGSAWVYSAINSEFVGYGTATSYKAGNGIRFPAVTVPKGATVTAAKMTVTGNVANSSAGVNSRVSVYNADNPATFTDVASLDAAYAGRTGAVAWDGIATFAVDGTYDSPSIATGVQTVVSRAGWASGNAMVVLWEDFEDRSTHTNATTRSTYAYDSSATKCALLTIEYTVGTVAPIQHYLTRRRVA